MRAEMLQSTSFVVFAIVCVVVVVGVFVAAREHLKTQREARRMRRDLDRRVLEIALRGRNETTTS